jgi:ADP-heptose:LPS heptosyltransferase
MELTEKPTHILIIRLSAMGDVAMTVPVIRAFLSQNPNVKATVVSRPFFEPFFQGIPNLNFFAVDLKKRHKGFLGIFKLFWDLQKLRIDVVADLHYVLRSRIISFLFALTAKKTAHIDKGRAAKKALTRSENKVFKSLTSMFERHQKTFEKLGFTLNLSQPIFPEKAILTNKIKEITGQKNNQNWIGIAPFAQYKTKIYPQDLMQKVIDDLSNNSKNTVFLFGGGVSEIAVLNQFAYAKSNVVVVAGKLTLAEELQLISNLDLMLSMDSGNAHIAAMLGVTVVTLWGATHPFAGFNPFNQSLENALAANRILYPKLPTSVYGNKKMAGYEDAMHSISPEIVVEKITSLLIRN